MERIAYYIIIGVLKTFALLPLRVLYVVSDAMSFIIHRCFRYRVQIVRKNLRNAFPDKDETWFRRTEKEYYRYLCDCIVETVKLLHFSDKELLRRVTVENAEVVSDYASADKPIILFMGHCANWEWVPALTLTVAKPRKMGALFRPLHSRVMNRVMLRIRSRFSSVCIPIKGAYRALLDMKKQYNTFMIGFIADQRPTGAVPKHWTYFLNQWTAFVAGGETIGNRVGARYLYLDLQRTKRGYMSLTFKEMRPEEDGEKDYPYTREFFRLLQETITRKPAFWLWSHNRWRDKME